VESYESCVCIPAVSAHGVETEVVLRTAWDAGSLDEVATRCLEAYGPEILGVLRARLRSSSDADDVFSMFVEDLWTGLRGFQWRCSLRAWAHRLALNATARWATAAPRRRDYNVPLSDLPELGAVIERVRTSTAMYLRTEVKSEIRRLRDELSLEDQLLLTLRIDKRMEWRDIAAAMGDGDLAEAALTREAARLRKRYQLATEKLRALARERGLLHDGAD
jgi:RNA polymerase sigma factor (sigma-70 family)